MQHTHTYAYWHTHPHANTHIDYSAGYSDPGADEHTHGHAHVYANTHSHIILSDTYTGETGPHAHAITYYHPDSGDSVEHHARAGVTCRLS